MDFIISEKVNEKVNPTICLNMIVKNESHIIKQTLEKLCQKIKFSYWVICDTGSTDNTQEIIKAFFASKNIPGQLFQDTWLNFAHNRTLALQYAFNKTDLLLVFDADDEIIGDIQMPQVYDLKYDEYHLKFGSEVGTAYTRVLLINNKKRFMYQSVIHEFICCLETGPTTNTVIEGNYYVVSGRCGNRSQDPDKYLKDAKILEAAHAEALIKKDPLYQRYAFYCANSYKDYGSFEEAIKWYKITLSQENWDQEKYVSCLYIYDCYEKLNQKETGFFYLVKAFKYDSERVECLYPLLVHYCCEGQYHIAYSYYLMVKEYYENQYLTVKPDKKLFVSIDKYNFFMPYYMILIADKVKDLDCVIRMFEIVFIKKMPITDIWYIRNFLYNLQFFIQYVKAENKDQFISLANQYLIFLYDQGIPLDTIECLKDYDTRFGIDVSYIFNTIPITNKVQTFSKEECAFSKNILIYTGFLDTEWNYSYLKNNALGGSEKAVAYLSKCFPKEYNIYVSGCVKNETFDNVTYIHLNQLTNLFQTTPFHTVIVSRYISFYEMFKECSFYQSFIWAHDIHLLSYGCKLNDNQILLKWDKYIDGCVCLTEWHRNIFTQQYPELTNKITVINNGLDIDSFTKINKMKKQINKFIYTSRPERGLNILLQLWPQILLELPDAELVLATYGTEPEVALMDIIKKYDSIKYLGKLTTEQLYAEMKTAEYWLYPTIFNETSCITGMEMLMSEVICLYYPLAGLIDTVGKYGIQLKAGNEIETIISLTNKQKILLRKRGKEYALSCSWSNRAKEWENVLFKDQFTNTNNKYKINIINLARRPDRKEQMINKLKLNDVTNYEFFEAIDGKKIEPSMFIKNLFKENDFNYRKGIIGCSLSHYNLWHKLLNDDNNNYYVILEDDVTICDNFNKKLQKCLDIISQNKIEYALIGGYYIHDECLNNTDINFSKITNFNIGNGTCGYIINKSACYKLINSIQTNGIKYAIDNTRIYTNYLDMYTINKYLVTSKAYQIHNNTDTDIQLDYDHFTFDSIPSYSIAFTDWWIDEYCGGIFDQENNFIKNTLSGYYNIRVIKPEQNPDILFYSVFGNDHKKFKANKKVFYSGESYSQREEADYNITFDENSDKNCRLPIWICYLDNILFEDCYKKKMGLFQIPNKPKFCSIICQLDSKNKERSNIINKLSKYIKVDCGGPFLNNIGYVVPKGINCSGKINHNNNYKFVLAFENKKYPGYVTEKICDAYKSKSIPIYWGSEDVINDFNPKTFINANDFENFDELVKYIIKVDTDQKLYESYFKEPIFSDYWLNIFNDFDQTFFSNLANNIVNNNKLKGQFYSQFEQDKYLEHNIFKGYKNGFYVDVGAHDGVTINNTLYFEKNHNWSGINIEPIKSVFDKLVINRPNDINLNCAVCNNDGVTDFLCNTGYTEMISGIKSNFDPRHLQRLHNENIQMGSTTEIIKVNTKKLETIFDENNISHINYLSIDVEGAEFEVIKSINFDKVFIDIINFENNYNDVSVPIIKYLEEKGYIQLHKKSVDIFMMHKQSIFYDPNLFYKYSQTWFLSSEIKNKLSNFLDKSKENKILEIGSFEGLSSVFFADNFIDNQKSNLTCVDPFLSINNNDHSQFLQNNEERNFDYNILTCKNSHKITVHKITSDIFFKNNNKSYNFIYIDGCHEADFIKRDMENSFKILEKNGIMWMDDYCGGDGIQIKNTMNNFLKKYKDQYELIHIGYQLAIKKI